METVTRTHHCGVLRKSDVGQQVALTGWVHNRRDHGGAIFVDLRDRHGLTQVVFRHDVAPEAHRLAEELRSEFCIGVQGRVDSRGENVNPNLPTGEIEITVTQLRIFSRSETPPFEIQDNVDTRESVRLQYRYLDLRRPAVQERFVLRSKCYGVIRSFLERHDFLELETPFMIKTRRAERATSSSPAG